MERAMIVKVELEYDARGGRLTMDEMVIVSSREDVEAAMERMARVAALMGALEVVVGYCRHFWEALRDFGASTSIDTQHFTWRVREPLEYQNA